MKHLILSFRYGNQDYRRYTNMNIDAKVTILHNAEFSVSLRTTDVHDCFVLVRSTKSESTPCSCSDSQRLHFRVNLELNQDRATHSSCLLKSIIQICRSIRTESRTAIRLCHRRCIQSRQVKCGCMRKSVQLEQQGCVLPDI